MERSDLEKAQKIFETATGNCDFAHEAPLRGLDGNPVFENHAFLVVLDQCDKKGLPQHFGCPHFFTDVIWRNASDILNLAEESRQWDVRGLKAQLESLKIDLLYLDRMCNSARTKMMNITQARTTDPNTVPTPARAHKQVAPYMEKYERLMPQLEEFRHLMLDLINELLEVTV